MGYTVAAQTNVEFLVLTKSDFESILRNYY